MSVTPDQPSEGNDRDNLVILLRHSHKFDGAATSAGWVRTVLDKLKALSPRQFENLVFDLIAANGMQNLRWRTPGSDVGRDIEGDLWNSDFAGQSRLERWYVECKRYDKAVDWPTVREKLAYAENHGADFLLFVTTSSLSPQCLDEVNTRNARGDRPHIRNWAGHDLVTRLGHEPKIPLKYALTAYARAAPKSFFSLSLELAKITQAAYAAHQFGSEPRRALEAGAAIAELMTWRMNDLEQFGKFVPQDFRAPDDVYSWLKIDAARSSFPVDRSGLRAIICLWRLLLRAHSIHLRAEDADTIMLTAEGNKTKPAAAAHRLLAEVCFWSDLEFNIKGTSISLTRRRK